MATDAPPALLCDLVDNLSCKGCYGIEWALKDGQLECKSYYNPQWRIAAVKEKGLQGLYTTHSSRYVFHVGDGLVGKVFQQKKVLFCKSVQEMFGDGVRASWSGWDGMEFARATLAKDFDINSCIFLPTETGVFEVGSTTTSEKMPCLFSSAVSSLVEANFSNLYVVEWNMIGSAWGPIGHRVPDPATNIEVPDLYKAPSPEMAKKLSKALEERRPIISTGKADPHTLAALLGDKQPNRVILWPIPGTSRVAEIAYSAPTAEGHLAASKLKGALPNACSGGLFKTCEILNAHIAVEWRLCGEKIYAAGHYNSAERIVKCDEKFEGNRYTFESYKFDFKLGEGVVGSVFSSGQSQLIPDLLQLPPEAFKRHELCKKFDVRTAVFLAVKGADGKVESVLEISTDRVDPMFEQDILAAEGSLPDCIMKELKILAAPVMGSIY